MHGENAYKILVDKPEEKNHLQDLGVDGDNIKINFKETGHVDWIQLAQYRVQRWDLMYRVRNLQVL
jgi:hypothetical protein